MKVICIDDNVKCFRGCAKSIIKFGCIYTVIDIHKYEEGDWYELAEDPGYDYGTEHFAPLSDIDETEMIREKLCPEIL